MPTKVGSHHSPKAHHPKKSHPAHSQSAGPSKSVLQSLYVSYDNYGMLRFGNAKPASLFGKAVVIIKPARGTVDGITVTAHLLKSDSHKVIFERSGGIAGLHLWSSPISSNFVPG